MPTRKKTYSKIIVTKPYGNVKSSNTKYVHELFDKTVVNFTYNFFFIVRYSFAIFIVNFTFLALESSGKLATMCSSIFSDCFEWIQSTTDFQTPHTRSIS